MSLLVKLPLEVLLYIITSVNRYSSIEIYNLIALTSHHLRIHLKKILPDLKLNTNDVAAAFFINRINNGVCSANLDQIELTLSQNLSFANVYGLFKSSGMWELAFHVLMNKCNSTPTYTVLNLSYHELLKHYHDRPRYKLESFRRNMDRNVRLANGIINGTLKFDVNGATTYDTMNFYRQFIDNGKFIVGIANMFMSIVRSDTRFKIKKCSNEDDVEMFDSMTILVGKYSKKDEINRLGMKKNKFNQAYKNRNKDGHFFEMSKSALQYLQK